LGEKMVFATGIVNPRVRQYDEISRA